MKNCRNEQNDCFKYNDVSSIELLLISYLISYRTTSLIGGSFGGAVDGVEMANHFLPAKRHLRASGKGTTEVSLLMGRLVVRG